MLNFESFPKSKSQTLMLIAASGSAVLLIGAYIFQIFGYPPCAMCLWQRWPHGAAIVIGFVATLFPTRVLALFGAVTVSTTAGIGIYHTGVERDWWEGPTSCTGTGALDGLTIDQLLPGADAPPLVMCDQVSWQFLTLSMATWNVLFSAILFILWIMAAIKK